MRLLGRGRKGPEEEFAQGNGKQPGMGMAEKTECLQRAWNYGQGDLK